MLLRISGTVYILLSDIRVVQEKRRRSLLPCFIFSSDIKGSDGMSPIQWQLLSNVLACVGKTGKTVAN